MGHRHNEELRNELIGDLTDKHALAITQALAAGDTELLSDATDAWTSTLEDDDLAAGLVRAVFAADSATAGVELRRHLDKVVKGMAEYRAISEVEQMEANAQSSRDDDRIEQYVWNRNMAGAV